MGAEQRKRIRELKKRKQERKKKQIFLRRLAALAVLAVAVIVLFSLMIRGCTKEGNKPSPAQTPSPSMTPAPDIWGQVAQEAPDIEHDPRNGHVKGIILATADPNAVGDDIDQRFFKNSAFLGNSMVASMEAYELLDDADYFGKVGLNVSTAETTAADNGIVPIIDELNAGKQYDKIFLMFGENECAWPSVETFKTDYTKIVKKIMRYQPEAHIYLLSITPMSKKASDASPDGANKDNIVDFNEHIKAVAEKAGVGYMDVYTPLADSKGYLPEEAASDGIHFGKDYYAKMLMSMSGSN